MREEMKQSGQLAMLKKSGRSGGLLLAAVALWAMLVLPAQAVLVVVDIGWNYYGNSDIDNNGLMANFGLQVGSIVQVIAYNSGVGPAPGVDADDNFEIWGAYNGPPLQGEPDYAPNNQAPTDQTVYNPESVPHDHEIVYSTHIGPAIGGWYNIYTSFFISGYDSIYIRVFGATDFPNGVVIASYWGISTVKTNDGTIGTWYVTYDDVTATNHVNYFEVIPEPGTFALLAVGAGGLWLSKRRRKTGVA
jgi:hypothetical protein